MYEIELQKKDQYTYIYKAKNSYNQLLTLEIFQSEDNNWNVCFFITSKRKKGYQKLQQTGKDGLSSLIWAKNCVIDWIFEMKRLHKKLKLYVYADDKRRRNVYKRYLLPLGFQIEKSKYQPLYMII